MQIKFCLLLFLFFIQACSRQDRTVIQNGNDCCLKSKVQSSNYILNNDDPNFTGSNDITFTAYPKVITRNVMEDKSGKIWFASWDGIIQFDGKKFTNFTNKYKLRRHRIFSMTEDKEGNLWFGSMGAGIYKYNVANDRFCNITTSHGLISDNIGCLYQHSNGAMWIGTEKGVTCIENAEIDNPCNYHFKNFTTASGLVHNDVNAIAEDDSGVIWFATSYGVSTISNGTFTTVFMPNGETYGNARTIIHDKTGCMWLGGEQGLWKLTATKSSNHFDLKQESFSNDFIGYLWLDHKGLIWISSGKFGANHMVLKNIDTKLPVMMQATPNEIRKEEGQIFGIIQDSKGNIWYGRSNGACRYDGKEFECFD